MGCRVAVVTKCCMVSLHVCGGFRTEFASFPAHENIEVAPRFVENLCRWRTEGGGVQPPPQKFRRLSKIVPKSTRL